MKLQGYDFDALAAKHGTPLYYYDMDAALSHLHELQHNLPDCVDVLFAIKSNPNRGVLEAFKPHVAGLDISSAGEMELARAVGYDPGVMSFAGPGKGLDELRAVIGAEIHLLSIESPRELERAEQISAELGKRQAITLRINPDSIPNAFMMKMGGRPSQFGIAEEDIDAPLQHALQSEKVAFKGIHIYSGTQCLDEPSILENLQQTLDIGVRLADKYDYHPEVMNMGGGFGVPYFPKQEPLDNASLSKAVGQLFARAVAEQPRYKNTRFILELGRYLIGTFGAYVTRVLDIKETRGKRFVIMDGGMHHCFAATGNFGQLVKKNYPIANVSAADAEASAHELVGPLCTPLDSMARALSLPEAHVDDLIVFNNCGAYAYTASPLLFLGHPTPPELVQLGGAVTVTREQMSASRFS